MANEMKLFDAREVSLVEAVRQQAALALASATDNLRLDVQVLKTLNDTAEANTSNIATISGSLSGLQTQLGTLGEQVAANLALLNKDVQTHTDIEANDSNIFVRIELTNIKTGQKQTLEKAMPLASETSAGGIDAVMYNAFVQMQADITDIYNSMQGMPRTAVVSGMAEDPSQSDITQAFINAIGEEPQANDRLVNVDFNVEYIYSSTGSWNYLGRSAIGFATSQTDGIVKHSTTHGTVGYYVEGVGQVNGWDELVAAIDTNRTNISNFLSAVNAGGTVGANTIMDFSPILFPMPFYVWNSYSREFGSHGAGTYKWRGGVLAPNGKIYGIPYTSATVIEIDPAAGTSREFGSHGAGTYKWLGGVLAPNGKIYGIPLNSATVLEINNMNNYPNFSIRRLISMNQQLNGANL